jgi:TonB family protein
MEALGLYLFKSVIWLSGFTLVYILFLQNERFFILNRFFLSAGILASFLMPLITLRYEVALSLPSADSTDTEGTILSLVENTNNKISFNIGLLLILLYLFGIIVIGVMMIRQNRSVIRSVINSSISASSPVKLIRTSDFSGSFSFFSWIFVNPSVSDIEIREIMNHEMVHIRQKHWVDLALAGMLCMLQWFNPVAWKYFRLIQQNHEYLADEGALQQTSDPAVYRATLLNQIAGCPVVSLANSFNYSLNKKRFEMMKNIMTSPYRKMKALFILPVFAIVLYAFAKPEYRYDSGNISNNPASLISQERTVKGTVIQNENSKPLERAIIVVTGTTTGTTTDASGRFKLENIPDGGALAVSYVGYKSKVIKPVFGSEMTIRMDLDTIKSEKFYNPTAPPPPPPPAPAKGIKFKGEGPPPLVIVDGKITDIVANEIDPESIHSVDVLKDNAATDKYGEKGKDGVIVIITKKHFQEMNNQPGTKPFVVVEELPQFPGGNAAMASWINSNMKYPEEAMKKKITGKVYVTFLIAENGKIKNAKVVKSVHPLLDAEAERVISNMPDWKPGTQSGKVVEVLYQVPVEFKLK